MGSSQPYRIPMKDFFSWSNSNHLIYLSISGHHFTWSNGKSGRRLTEKCIGMTIGNKDWIDLCLYLSFTTITKKCSDHYLILMNFEIHEAKYPSQFKYMQMWSLHEDCKAIISKTWETNMVGHPMFILFKKLKLLKAYLKFWNNISFGNIHEMVKLAKDKLNNIQQRTRNNGHNEVAQLKRKWLKRISILL